MTSGVGRGRGWLNLNKNNPVRPGKPVSPTLNGPIIDVTQPPPNVNSISLTNIINPKYAKLISHINHLNSNDDGILLNQKLKFITETWLQECKTSDEVEESFNYIYQKSLDDEVFSIKLVIMVSSHSFISIEICQQKIRSLFVASIQNTFENAKELQVTNPVVFRNAVRILSEFYNKARLSDGRPIKFLATPLLCYFDMLLSSAQPADLELFTTQLYLNGSGIKNDYAQKLNELLNKVRQLLICNVQLTQTCKLYLLLATDIANNRFTLLPSDIHKFYQDQLGDKVMTHFQGSLGALSIQTQQSSKTLDSFQSNVNVLQVTPPDSTSPINEAALPLHMQKNVLPPPPSQQQQKPNPNSQNKYSITNSVSQNFNTGQNFNSDSGINVGTWDNNKEKTSANSREKTGRPILGSGARFQKSKKEDSNWRDHSKENSAGWNSKQKSHGSTAWSTGDKKTSHSKNYNKSWEHDDRFENEYN